MPRPCASGWLGSAPAVSRGSSNPTIVPLDALGVPSSIGGMLCSRQRGSQDALQQPRGQSGCEAGHLTWRQRGQRRQGGVGGGAESLCSLARAVPLAALHHSFL
ncbi:hypothetical protein ABPG75_002166 [Micractinium tetrahymenae]